MTTLGNVLVPEGATVTVPRRRLWPRWFAGFLFGLIVSLGLAGGALYAYDMRHEGRVLTGVDVGGVDLSGLDSAQATAALDSAFASYGDGRVIIRSTAGDVSVPYAAFARRADVQGMLDEAMRTGRAGTTFERALALVHLAQAGHSVAPRVLLDEVALTAGVTAAVSSLDLDPIDAEVVKGKQEIYTTPARPGRRMDGTLAAAGAIETLRRTDAPAEVTVEATATEIPPEHGDDEALAAKAEAERMIGDVKVTYRKSNWTIRAARVRTWITFEKDAGGATRPVLDETKIPGVLKNIAKVVRRAPDSATFLKTRGGKVIGVVAGRDGQKLDVAATSAAIAGVIASRAEGTPAKPEKPVIVKVAKVPPKFTTAQALKKAPLMKALGTWKTWFPVSERNYFGANIWLPAKIIDGTVLQPGQSFEWWRALGPVTPARGYGPGGFIAGDHTEPTGALGGGMCSSSTTLFNAALRAGLQMGARSNHKYYIGRYPLGLDATVSKTRNGSQTVSFTNDTKGPIVIRTFRYRAGGRGWVRYEIWGVPDGRKVSIGRPAVSNVRKATTATEYVSSLPKGVREQIEYPADGMDVAVARVVRDRNGRIIHSETYRTHYVLWNGLVHIGR